MSISNFGQKMRLEGNSTLVLHDPDPLTTGNNGRIPANLQTEEWPLPLTYRVGVAYDVLNFEGHKLVIAVDAWHPSDNYESVNVGGEYIFNDFIALRGGYKSFFLQNSEERFSAGVGIRQSLIGNTQFRIDYAYQDFQKLKYVQKFSIGILF
jgi:hypothetical protein